MIVTPGTTADSAILNSLSLSPTAQPYENSLLNHLQLKFPWCMFLNTKILMPLLPQIRILDLLVSIFSFYCAPEMVLHNFMEYPQLDLLDMLMDYNRTRFKSKYILWVAMCYLITYKP
jgi:hypothetical protein